MRRPRLLPIIHLLIPVAHVHLPSQHEITKTQLVTAETICYFCHFDILTVFFMTKFSEMTPRCREAVLFAPYVAEFFLNSPQSIFPVMLWIATVLLVKPEAAMFCFHFFSWLPLLCFEIEIQTVQWQTHEQRCLLLPAVSSSL